MADSCGDAAMPNGLGDDGSSEASSASSAAARACSRSIWRLIVRSSALLSTFGEILKAW
jgi:hypothetical protein